MQEYVQCRNTIFKYIVVSLFDLSYETTLKTTPNVSLNNQVDISTHVGCSENFRGNAWRVWTEVK